jgi:hypothetical protein
MDLSSFSNEELLALKAGDMSKLSDASLRILQNGGRKPDEIVQETHPDFSWGSRFALKNFGGSPEVEEQFIKKEGFETKIGGNGQRLIKKPGEEKWSVLDPKGFDLADITDVGYDLAAGLGSGLATAAAGLGAGAATGGAGAIPAAMAAGAGSSAGLEFLRQKIGAGLGTHQGSTDVGDVALAGGLGALAPVLFGTGASVGKIGAKAGQEAVGQRLLGTIGQGTMSALSEAEKKAAAEILGQSQRGISKLLFSSDAAQNASKQAPEAIKNILGKAGKKFNMMQAGDIMSEKGLSDVVIASADKVKNTMLGVKQSLQKEFTNALDQVGGIDPRPHFDSFQKILDNLEASDLPIAKAQAKKLSADLDNLFFRTVEDESGEPVKIALDSISGQDAMRLKQELKDLGSTFVNTEGKPVHSKEVMNAANEAMFSLSDVIDKRINQAGGNELMGRYRDFTAMEREVMPLFEDPNKMYTFLRTANNKTKKHKAQVIDKIDKKFDLGIKDTIDQFDVMARYADAPWSPVSTGTTSTSQTLDAQAGGGAIGKLLGNLGFGNPGGIAGQAIGRIGAGRVMSRGMEKKLIQTKEFLKDIGLNKGIKDADQFTIGDLIRGIDEFKVKPSAPSTFNMLMNASKERGE